MTNNIGLAAGAFHFKKRPEFQRVSFQSVLYPFPLNAFMALRVLHEAGPEQRDQLLPFFGSQFLMPACF